MLFKKSTSTFYSSLTVMNDNNPLTVLEILQGPLTARKRKGNRLV